MAKRKHIPCSRTQFTSQGEYEECLERQRHKRSGDTYDAANRLYLGLLLLDEDNDGEADEDEDDDADE